MSKRLFFVIFMGFLGLTLAFIVRIIPSSAILIMKNLYNWEERQQGIVLSGFYVGYCMLQVVGGKLSQRYGSKYIMLFALLGSGIINSFVPLSSNVIIVTALRVLAGAIQSMYWVSCLNLISRWIPPESASTAISFCLSGQHLGTALAHGLYPITAKATTWQTPFYGTLGLIIIWSIIWVLFVSSEPKKTGSYVTKDSTELNESDQEDEAPTPISKILKSKSFWGYFIMTFCYNWVFYFLVSYMPKYLSFIMGMELNTVGVYSLLGYFGLYLTTLVNGKISDTFLRLGVKKVYVKKLLLFIGMLPIIVSLWTVANVKAKDLWIIKFITFSIAISGFAHGTFMTAPADLCPKSPGVAGGIANTAGFFPGIIAPLLSGLILDLGNCHNVQKSIPDSCYIAWDFLFYLTSGIALLGLISWSTYYNALPIL